MTWPWNAVLLIGTGLIGCAGLFVFGTSPTAPKYGRPIGYYEP